jgi:hypothetical protein
MGFLIFSVLVLTSNLFAQLAQIDIPIITVNGSYSQTLRVGLDVTATTGIDPSLGESLLPPLPPVGVYDIRFDLTPYGHQYMETWKDYRPAAVFPFSGTYEHKMMWQISAGTTTIVLNYELPSGTEMNIKDIFGGTIFNSGVLSGAGSYSIPALSTNKAYITVSYTNISPAIQSVSEEIFQPADYVLYQNYPNPFNPGTIIEFAIPEYSGNVTLIIYDGLGQKVSELFNGALHAGYYKYKWDAGKNPSGFYIYQLKTDNFISTKGMMFLK